LADPLGSISLGAHLQSEERRDTHFVNVTRMKCLLKCVLSLNEEEAQVLSYLIVHGRGAIAKDIARSLGRNPEVVRRALRSLYARSLVVRRPYPLRRGGRAYMYEVPQSLVKALMGVCSKMDELIKSVTSENKNVYSMS